MTKRKKRPVTPKSVINAGISKIWLWSRERAWSIKEHGPLCGMCQEAKWEHVHHNNPVDWQRIYNVIYEELLNKNTIPLCKQCHIDLHELQKDAIEFGDRE